MKLYTKFFNILSENEINYFAQLEGVIDSVDEYSELQVTKALDHYNFRLVPSIPKYTNSLIDAIITYHNMLNIRLDFSKSIKTTATINFKIHFAE